MSTMEPDEGAQPDDQRADAPRWENIEAEGGSEAPRWEGAEAPRWEGTQTSESDDADTDADDGAADDADPSTDT